MNYIFPVDAPKRKVIKQLELFDFKVIREKEHISMLHKDPDGSKTPLTMPNHGKVKASTLRTIYTPGPGISRDGLLEDGLGLL